MIKEKIYADDNVSILKENDKFYIRYDAGSHQVAMREDEISEEEAGLVAKGVEDEITNILFKLQKRLQDSGVNPYISNIPK